MLGRAGVDFVCDSSLSPPSDLGRLGGDLVGVGFVSVLLGVVFLGRVFGGSFSYAAGGRAVHRGGGGGGSISLVTVGRAVR